MGIRASRNERLFGLLVLAISLSWQDCTDDLVDSSDEVIRDEDSIEEVIAVTGWVVDSSEEDRMVKSSFFVT